MNSKAKKGIFTIFILLLVVIQPCYCTEAATEKAKPIISVSFFCNDDFDNSQVTLVSMSIISANFFPGMKRQMFASVLFPTAETISWSSSNLDVAIVSDSGLVTAVSPGIALITASMGGSSSSCEVVIEDPKRFKNITTKQMTDSQMEIIKEYDKRGILKKQTMIKEYSDTVVTYHYDNNGYLKSINWIYNSLGRDDVYCEFPDPASYKVYYYNILAVRKTTSIDSEYGETTKWIYEYDEAGRTVKKKVYGTLEGEPTHLLVSKKYHYDSNGLLKKEVITDYDSFGEKNMISKKKYVYDDHANLIKVKTK